jgi:hypothetical protein
MANLTIEMPDELARGLAGIAACQHKSVQQLAIERLTLLGESDAAYPVGSAAAILRAMHEPPHLSVSDVDELDAAIAAGHLPVQTPDLFSHESAS